MPVGNIIVPEQKRTSIRFLLLVSILLIGLLGSGIWLAYKLSGNDFADQIIEFWSWLDDPSETTNELLDSDRQRTQYQELHADLMKSLESEQSEKLLDYGRSKFRDQIVLSVSRAEEAFDDGDIDNALRILKLSSDQWREAITEIQANFSESSNLDNIQTVLFDKEQENASQNSSVRASASMNVVNVNDEEPSLVNSTQIDEKTFANVIQSTPINKQRTSGTISNPQIPPKIGQEKTPTPSQLDTLDSTIATTAQVEPIDSPDKIERIGNDYLPDESQRISEAEAITSATVDENSVKMTVNLNESAGADVAALELQPENESAQSSADETTNSLPNSTRGSDESINLPESIAPTEVVDTATAEQKSTQQTIGQDKTLNSEVAALELQPEVESAQSSADETINSLPNSTRGSDESIAPTEVVDTATAEQKSTQQTIEQDKSLNSEVAALVLRPEIDSAQSSADETIYLLPNSTRGSDESINLPESIAPTKVVATATVEQKSTQQTIEQDKTPISEVAALVLQHQTETIESPLDETLISRTDSNVDGEESKQLLKVASSTEKANTANGNEKSIEQTVELEDLSGTEVAALIPPSATEIVDPITDSSTRSKSDSSDENGQLKKLQYENSDVELARMIPDLQNNQKIVPHNDSIVKRVLLNRQKAQEAYQEQDFNEAKRLIATALADAKTAAEQEHEYFKLNLTIAKEAYSKQNPDTAKEAIERAVSLRPNSHEALYWQQKIEILPIFLEAQQDAELARSSGDPQAEIDALERVVLYSSNADEAAQRITELKQEIRDRKFANTINRGLQALSDGDLEQAKRNLAQAQKQRPNSSDTAKLQNQVTEAELQQTISRHLATANNAWEEDDWKNALIHYQKVLAIDPRLDEALQGREFASKITALQARIDEFLVKPHRLSSPNIATAAKSAVKDALAFGVFSPALKLSTESLSNAILEWQTPIPVRILSDGETDIGIRGVGRIGKTLGRSIELLPGTYVFEGKRKGFRSTLVEMVVKNNNDDLMEVTVICSERS